MNAFTAIREGFRIAGRHKRLVLVLWLTPLLPALLVGAMAAANLAPALGPSLFAEGVLDGDWFVVLMEFRSSPADALGTIVGRGTMVMLVVTILLQILVTAGVVETVLERRPDNPFILGVRRNAGRFARTTLLLLALTFVLLVVCRLVAKAFFALAESQSNGHFDVLGVLLAVVLFLLLWAPLDLAADLSRIAAARHGGRSMVRGFVRAWWSAVRTPSLFAPLYAVFLVLPLAVHAVYVLVRSPWTPGTGLAITVLVLAQQLVMVIRAYFKLALWGSETAAYRRLEEPRWCGSEARRARTHDAPDPAAAI
jgi:hypothetical protein